MDVGIFSKSIIITAAVVNCTIVAVHNIIVEYHRYSRLLCVKRSFFSGCIMRILFTTINRVRYKYNTNKNVSTKLRRYRVKNRVKNRILKSKNIQIFTQWSESKYRRSKRFSSFNFFPFYLCNQSNFVFFFS